MRNALDEVAAQEQGPSKDGWARRWLSEKTRKFTINRPKGSTAGVISSSSGWDSHEYAVTVQWGQNNVTLQYYVLPQYRRAFGSRHFDKAD
jgi:hypothetical protein